MNLNCSRVQIVMHFLGKFQNLYIYWPVHKSTCVKFSSWEWQFNDAKIQNFLSSIKISYRYFSSYWGRTDFNLSILILEHFLFFNGFFPTLSEYPKNSLNKVIVRQNNWISGIKGTFVQRIWRVSCCPSVSDFESKSGTDGKFGWHVWEYCPYRLI